MQPDEERRGKEPHKYGVHCNWLKPRQQVLLVKAIARLRSLAFTDMRVFSMFSGVCNIGWFAVVFWPVITHEQADIVGFMARVIYVAPVHVIAWPVLLLGMTEIYCAIFNLYYCRLFVAFVSMWWWGWLAGVALLDPPNESAGMIFCIVVLFRFWSFVTVNFTHPASPRYYDAK
jgi:hypothetical protein